MLRKLKLETQNEITHLQILPWPKHDVEFYWTRGKRRQLEVQNGYFRSRSNR